MPIIFLKMKLTYNLGTMKVVGFENLFLELLLDRGEDLEYFNGGLKLAKQNILKVVPQQTFGDHFTFWARCVQTIKI